MKLYWLDVETTDLSPDRGVLLELAIAEADLDRPFVDSVRDWVFRFKDFDSLSPFILNMHGGSGLLAERDRSTTTVAEIEDYLLTVVPEAVDREDVPTLAGSSVHFDHGFLRVHMPRLAARFSHRHYDVSAVKLFCRSLGMPKLPKAETHRASADVLESIRAREDVRGLDEVWVGCGLDTDLDLRSQGRQMTMSSFTIKVPNDDEGEGLGAYGNCGRTRKS